MNNIKQLHEVMTIEKVKISYEDFKMIKQHKYNDKYIKELVAYKLQIGVSTIQDVDFNYKLTFDIYLIDDLKRLQYNYKQFLKSQKVKSKPLEIGDMIDL
jgi:hypothetical protein